MRFSEAINVFNKYRSLEKDPKTIKGNSLYLKQFCLYLRNPLITQIVPDQIVEYMTLMKELGWSAATIEAKQVAFTQFFKFWRRKEYPVLNWELIPRVKREWHQPKVARVEDLRKLIELCDKYPKDPYFIRNKAMILLTADTGARNGEICSFNMDIDTENYESFGEVKQYKYIIKTEKSRGQKPFRAVFWYNETNEALNKWIAVRKKLFVADQDALFINTHRGQGSRGIGKRISMVNFALTLRKLSVMAKIPFFNAHSLRHLKGNELAFNGASNSIISAVLGHASLNSSRIYTDLNDKQVGIVHAKYKRT